MMTTFPTNTTSSFNTLPSRDETSMTIGNFSPNTDFIHDSILVQEESINTSFNNSLHRNDVYPSPKMYTPFKDTLK